MSNKRIFLIAVPLIILVIVSFKVSRVQSYTYTPTANTTLTSVPSIDLSIPNIPAFLDIPGINLKTNIIEIGVTKEGNLDVPPNYSEVGWYKYGTVPGQKGSAVLDGHVDNGGYTPTLPGPFKNLRNLDIGDEIFVEMQNGQRLRYVVRNSDVYQTNKFIDFFVHIFRRPIFPFHH